MDLSKLSQNQKIALGGGALVLIASFLPWFGESGFSFNAWDSDFFAWGGTLLVVVGIAILALKVFEVNDLALANLAAEQLALIATALGTLFIVLQLLVGESALGFSISRKFGIFVAVLAAAAATYGAFGSMKDAGLEIPSADDFKSSDDN